MINFGHIDAAVSVQALTSSDWFVRRFGCGDRLTALGRARAGAPDRQDLDEAA